MMPAAIADTPPRREGARLAGAGAGPGSSFRSGLRGSAAAPRPKVGGSFGSPAGFGEAGVLAPGAAGLLGAGFPLGGTDVAAPVVTVAGLRSSFELPGVELGPAASGLGEGFFSSAGPAAAGDGPVDSGLPATTFSSLSAGLAATSSGFPAFEDDVVADMDGLAAFVLSCAATVVDVFGAASAGGPF